MTTQTLSPCKNRHSKRYESTQVDTFLPAVDLYETDDAVLLMFDMPGVSKENVGLTVERGTLTVTGETSQEEGDAAVYREVRTRNFRRTFSLNEAVDPDGITAEIKAGVLTVRIAKPEKAKPKRIEIAAG